VDTFITLNGGTNALVEVTHTIQTGGYATGPLFSGAPFGYWSAGSELFGLPQSSVVGSSTPGGSMTHTLTASVIGSLGIRHHLGFLVGINTNWDGSHAVGASASGTFSVRSLTPGVDAILTTGGALSEEKQFAVVDTLAEIYQNAGISEADARAAIEEANSILKQAHIRLNTYGLLSGVTDGDIGGDAIFSKAERDAVRADGGALTMGGRNGMTLVFAKQVAAESIDTLGVAIGSNPTVIVSDSGGARSTGATIAHEVLHAFGLSHENDPTNLMYPFSPAGTNISTDQIDRIVSEPHLRSWSKSKLSHSPGLLTSLQKGAGQDEIADIVVGNPAYLDLDHISLSSTAAETFIKGRLAVADLFPSAGAVDAIYRIGFEVDAANTGLDFSLDLSIGGDASVQPLTVSAVLNDLRPGGMSVPIPDSAIADLVEFDSDTTPAPVASELTFSFEKTLLGVQSSTNEIPMSVVSHQSGVDTDELDFTMDMGWWLKQPELGLFQARASAGELVNYEVFRLTPNTSFDIFVDDELVASDTTDANGEYTGAFAVPLIETSDDYFITAVDSSGRSAFNIMELSPLPGDYNGNGVVDAADYVVWRKTLGQSGQRLAADGNGNGQIDSGDYDFWKAHFGQTVPSVSAGAANKANSAVPEPASLILFTLGIALSCIPSRRVGIQSLPCWDYSH
jgi:hypothetical protein